MKKSDQRRLLGWSDFNTSIDPDYRKSVFEDRKSLGIIRDDDSSSSEDEDSDVKLLFNPSSEEDSSKLLYDSLFIPASEEPLDGFERFELYSIEVQRVEKDREFLTIHVDSPWTEQIIYKRNPEDKLPIGKPLPLLGPFRPLSSPDPIFIWFGDMKWRWEVSKFTPIPYNPDKVHPEGVSTEIIDDVTANKDRDRVPSRVVMRYEWHNNSVEASFRFKLSFDDYIPGCIIEIISGVISATTDGCSETERVLRRFTKKKKKRGKRKKKVVDDNRRFRHGEIMLLDRGIISMPKNSELHVSVDLSYCIFWRGERMRERTIKGSRCIKVPKNPGVSQLCFRNDDGDFFPTLDLEVDWSDEIYPFLLCTGREKVCYSKPREKSTDDDSFDFFPDPTEAEDLELFPDPTEAEDSELFPDPTEA